MDFHSVLLVIGAIVLALFLFYKRKSPLQGRRIPGPTGIPGLGCLSIDTAKMHLPFYEWAKQYGKIFQLDFLHKKVIVLNDVSLIRKAFASEQYANYFCNRPDTFAAKHVLQTHKDLALATQYDKKTLLLRKMLHKCLQIQSSEASSFEINMRKEIKCLLERIENFEGGDFNIKELIRESYGNLTSISLSGRSPEKQYTDLLWSYNEDLVLLMATSLDLLLKMFPFMKAMPGKTGDLIRRTIAAQENLLTRYLDQSQNEESGLVAAVLNFQKEENNKAGAEVITDENVKGILLDIMIGSMTSTTIAIVTTILMLIHHPDMMAMVQKEINESVGRHRPPEISDKHDQPFLMACILEAMRFSSFGPLGLPHLVRDDVQFEDYHFSKGAIMFANMWYTHRDEQLWENPWEFQPQRFLTSSGELVSPSHPSRQNLITFSVGKRSCPGADYSVGRIFLYLASILQRFDIKAPRDVPLMDCDPSLFKPGLFLEPVDFMCRAEKREE